jgi:tRNA G46 methylase TrmB
MFVSRGMKKNKGITKSLIRRFGNHALRPFQLSIEQRWRGPGEIVSIEGMSQEEACNRFAWLKQKLSFQPNRIVDIGASDGRWTLPMVKIFPNANFLLIEPLSQNIAEE